MKDEHLLAHEAHKHGDASMHHHHSHATSSRHAYGHHLLQVEDLCVSFSMYDPDETHFFRARKKDVSVISDLSISVHAGEIMAIVGASGSGKSLWPIAFWASMSPMPLSREQSGSTAFAKMPRRSRSCAVARLRSFRRALPTLTLLVKVGRQVRGVARDAADAERRAERQRALFEHYGLAPKLRRCIRLNCRAAWPAACFWRVPWSKARVLLWPTSRRLVSIWIWQCAPRRSSRIRRCGWRRAAYHARHRARIARGRPYRRIQRRNGHRRNRRRKLRRPEPVAPPVFARTVARASRQWIFGARGSDWVGGLWAMRV